MGARDAEQGAGSARAVSVPNAVYAVSAEPTEDSTEASQPVD
jgi:hypothetical protein